MGDRVTVAGKLNDDRFQRLAVACRFLERESGIQCSVLGMLPIDYELWVSKTLESAGITHKSAVVALIGDANTYLGGEAEFMEWAKEHFGYDDSKTNGAIFKRLAKKEFLRYMTESKRQFARMELSQDKQPIGQLLVEIFADECPKTAAEFVKLLTSTRLDGAYGYENCPVHRVVPGGWMQSGDVVSGHGNGDPGHTFPDETFKIRHDKPGIIGCASKTATPHTNNSHFYITFAPCPFLDRKKVAFARVIDGMRALRLVEKTKLRFERPATTIRFSKCEMVYPAPAAAGSEAPAAETA
eukprot:jgi/Tetstr1/465077/TSEL_009805.t1